MTIEMLFILHRPLYPILSFSGFNERDRGISPSNGEIILLIQDSWLHEEPVDESECIPVDFCNSI